MNKTSSLNYFLRKSPVLRALCWVLVALVFALVSLLIGIRVKQKPVINSLTPPVASPGDLIIISGKDFGSSKESGSVEFGGNRLTSSSYISWNNSEIKIVLPANVQDGLVTVTTKNGTSRPAFFANSTSAPVAVPQNVQTTQPLITSISLEKTTVGSLITIRGVNFGSMRDSSAVFFTAGREQNPSTETAASVSSTDLNFISGNEDNADYEYWSDSEIRMHIPDGAISGNMYIHNAKGKSALRKIEIDTKAGIKTCISPKTYLIQVSANIADTAGDKDSQIIMRFPRPFVTYSQPVAELTECSTEPILSDFQHTLIQQTSGAKSSSQKANFTHNFAVTVYETRTDIKASYIKTGDSDLPKTVREKTTKSDQIIPSNSEEVINLSRVISKGEKNPYNIAVLTYNYMISNFSVAEKSRKNQKSPVELIKSKNGDAYDFAVIFAALLRASGVPALLNSGIIIEADLKTKSHWWCEFYADSIGWIPVDPALGAGMKYQSWQKDINPEIFYFGNLDSQHILFSRGWNEIKPSAPNNKIVQYPKSYALQSIWEEASGKTIKYSSYWAEPTVIGVY